MNINFGLIFIYNKEIVISFCCFIFLYTFRKFVQKFLSKRIAMFEWKRERKKKEKKDFRSETNLKFKFH